MSPNVRLRLLMAGLAVLSSIAGHHAVMAQTAPAEAGDAADAAVETDGELDSVQARLADRFDRLELSVARLAELSGSTQPRRAALLRQLVAQSRARDVAGKFDEVIASLEKQSYSSAIDGQTALEGDLQNLLALLLQEDRDRQIESERKRVAKFLQEVNRLIRQQRGVSARTDGGDETAEVAGDQKEVSDKTAKLGDEIQQSVETKEEKARREQAEGSEKGEGSEAKEGEQKPQSGESQAESGDSKPTPTPSDSSKGEGKPAKPDSGGKPQSGEPGQGESSEGESEQAQSEQAQASPAERAAQRLKQAQQKMQEAIKKLEETQRKGAMADQQEAVEQLEQAKAELERILRQLREEELERMLVMIEARIRKMLEEQVQVYEETKQVSAAAEEAAEHEVEIASGRLARRESLIVREADRALVLLREDGTSVAFPEAIEQARDDMQSVATRLREVKVDVVTQRLEEDVIAALEESLAAMQQALKELREQKGKPPQQGGGEPGEKPLVDQLAELRMIRSLQSRVNNRTKLYGDMITGEQALEDELVQSLRELGLRQQKIFQATQDLETKEN